MIFRYNLRLTMIPSRVDCGAEGFSFSFSLCFAFLSFLNGVWPVALSFFAVKFLSNQLEIRSERRVDKLGTSCDPRALSGSSFS